MNTMLHAIDCPACPAHEDNQGLHKCKGEELPSNPTWDCNCNVYGKWTIHFRYISPDDTHTPIYHLSVESTRLFAANADEAWRSFLEAFSSAGPGNFELIKLEREHNE